MANMMSLNVSDEVIKAAVREEVNAGIVKALGNPEVVVRDAIHEMTNKYVDSKGEFVKRILGVRFHTLIGLRKTPLKKR